MPGGEAECRSGSVLCVRVHLGDKVSKAPSSFPPSLSLLPSC